MSHPAAGHRHPARRADRHVGALMFCLALGHDQWARRRSAADNKHRSRWIGGRTVAFGSPPRGGRRAEPLAAR